MTDCVRDCYNQAILDKRIYFGFLMIFMQQLAASSTSATRTSPERHLEALQKSGEPLSLFPFISYEEWVDLDGQEQAATFLGKRLKALRNELAEVGMLLEDVQACEWAGPDAKAEALLEWIYRLQREKGDLELKILAFTEIVPTQPALRYFLTDHGFALAYLNGSMNIGQRKRAQEELAKIARTLIYTDVGSDGLSLQFRHAVSNYDIPWNPMRIEQRIGRISCIGQTHAIHAVNLLFDETVRFRIREVLEKKLTVVLCEFGIDKAGDVLDSADRGQIFESLYADAILHTEGADKKVKNAIDRVRKQAEAAKECMSILGPSSALSPREAQRLKAHPLPHWVERMTVSYSHSSGGAATRRGTVWDLVWKDGCADSNLVLTTTDLEEMPTARHLPLSNARVLGLVTRLPRFAPGQPISSAKLSDLPADLLGYRSLWRIRSLGDVRSRWQITPRLLLDDGQCLTQTVRHVRGLLLTVCPAIRGQVMGEVTEDSFSITHEAAETQGRPSHDKLVRAHLDRLSREQGEGGYAFGAHWLVVEGIDLPAVRTHQLAQIEEGDRHWRDSLQSQAQVTSEMSALIIVHLEGGKPGA